MNKNNFKRVGGLLLILLVLSTGCNKKENEVITYEKENMDIVEKESNIVDGDSDIGNESNLIEDIKVVSEKIEDDCYVSVVKAYDYNNKMIWSYTTETIYSWEPYYTEYYIGRNTIYVNDGGNLVALDSNTGKKQWTKTDYDGRERCQSVEDDKYLYIIGDAGWQLSIIDKATGKTIRNFERINELDKTDSKTEYNSLTNPSIDVDVIGNYGLIYIEADQNLETSKKEVTISFNPKDYSVKIVED